MSGFNQQYYPGQQQPFNSYDQNRGGYNNPGAAGQPQFLNNAFGLMGNKEFQQIGVNYLQNQIADRLGKTPSFSDYIFTSNIRSYFNVDNTYVLKKLFKIILPFVGTRDAESSQADFGTHNYGMPNEHATQHKKSLLSPDLYIPLMSFMTFILMVCLARAMEQEFKPDLIGYYTINCLFFAGLEMLLYKIILLVVKVKTLSSLDLIAFLNYKFVGLCLIVLVSYFAIESWFITVVKMYFSISFVYCMFVELRSHAEGVAEGIDIGKTSLNSNTIVYFLSGLQFATMWLLVMTTIG